MKVFGETAAFNSGPEMDKLNVGLSLSQEGGKSCQGPRGSSLKDTEPTGKAPTQLRRDNVSTKHNDPEVETPNT